MYQNIILAYDGSLESQHALLNCKDLSKWEHAKVHLVSIIPYELISMGHENSICSNSQNKNEQDSCSKILREGVEQLHKTGIEAYGKLLNGDAVDEIVKYATITGADLIMLGHKHGENRFEHWWRSSTPKALIEHSPCSVLVVIIK